MSLDPTRDDPIFRSEEDRLKFWEERDAEPVYEGNIQRVGRKGKTDFCLCKRCRPMPSDVESYCCQALLM